MTMHDDAESVPVEDDEVLYASDFGFGIVPLGPFFNGRRFLCCGGHCDKPCPYPQTRKNWKP